jgi:hypothetical protein
MELLSVIRRWHYRDHFSIREISRRTGADSDEAGHAFQKEAGH